MADFYIVLFSTQTVLPSQVVPRKYEYQRHGAALDLRTLLREDASKSKAALARHIGQLKLTPKETEKGPVYESRNPMKAWIAADPFKGGVRVLITGLQGFERIVMFAPDEAPAVIVEWVTEISRSPPVLSAM